MKSKVLYICGMVLLASSAFAQNGWNWPEDPEEKKEVQLTYTLYSDSYKGGNYDEAKVHLDKLLTNYPKLNKSIYINGIKIYKEAWKNEKDATKKSAAVDKVLSLWSGRFEHYPSEEKTNIDRMAIDAFLMLYRNSDKTQYLLDLFGKTMEVRGEKTNYSVPKYYMRTVTLAKARGIDMNESKILEIYSDAIRILEAQIKSLKSQGKSTSKQESAIEEIDGDLSKLGVIDCDFIVAKLVPDFEQNPDDAELAQKIFSFAFDGGCTDAQWFTNAAIKVYDNDPNYGVAFLLASRYLKEKDYATAKEYFLKAVDLTDDNTDKGKALKQIASASRIAGNKVEAREYALKTLEADPSLASDMYTMIGEMYMGSSECDKKTSQIDDRARFIAAYEMFVKAGNRSRMAAAKEQFPTISDIFTANREEGENLKVACWINATVKLQRRPDSQ